MIISNFPCSQFLQKKQDSFFFTSKENECKNPSYIDLFMHCPKACQFIMFFKWINISNFHWSQFLQKKQDYFFFTSKEKEWKIHLTLSPLCTALKPVSLLCRKEIWIVLSIFWLSQSHICYSFWDCIFTLVKGYYIPIVFHNQKK